MALSAEGLEGIVACESSISSIEGDDLRFRGINIDELVAHSNYEETAYLLLHGKLPTKQQLDLFKERLNEHSALVPETINLINSIPKTANPMAMLRTVVSMLGIIDVDAKDNTMEANYRKARRLIAKIPIIIATFYRVRNGHESIVPKKEYTIAENFLYTLTGEKPRPEFVKAMDTALIIHADHELNASTFAARVTVATLSDMHSGVTSALGALKGPLHGGANEKVMEMIEAIGSIDKVDSFIERALTNKEKIMGFGHRVYKNDVDPRAKHLKNLSKQLCEISDMMNKHEISNRIEQLMKQKKNLSPNVDFYSATVYSSMGIPRDLFTPIFAASRIAGWASHIIEQLENNRLIRPRAEYTGTKSNYVPIEKR